MKQTKSTIEKRTRRHARIRSKVFGTALRPRLSVFKSNRSISAQLIDDEKSVTIAAAHSRDAKGKSLLEKSFAVGESIATQATGKKVAQVVFDRGGFIYTGCVKAVADGARKGGLEF